jgi:hypothetical protein
MYVLGARTSQVDAFTPPAGLAQSLDGPFVPANRAALASAPAPVSVVPVSNRRRSAERSVYRNTSQEDRVWAREEDVRRRDDRTWTKSAMIIGGSAASGAGVGGIAAGKKGALIGAAIGGGAASIYEATKRR